MTTNQDRMTFNGQVLPNDYQKDVVDLSQFADNKILEILAPLRDGIARLRGNGEDEAAGRLHDLHNRLEYLLQLSYYTLGLVGEAGEIAEKVKKCIRDKEGVIQDHEVDEYGKEVGDVQWYAARLAWSFGQTLNQVMRGNLGKLFDRARRGVISGSGDNR